MEIYLQRVLSRVIQRVGQRPSLLLPISASATDSLNPLVIRHSRPCPASLVGGVRTWYACTPKHSSQVVRDRHGQLANVISLNIQNVLVVSYIAIHHFKNKTKKTDGSHHFGASPPRPDAVLAQVSSRLLIQHTQ
jgi:hypothetical protein